MHKAYSSAEVPDSPGIYFFYLTNISLVKIGLYRGEPASDKTLTNARENLADRISSAAKLFQSLTLEGVASERDRAQFFNNEFELTLAQTPSKMDDEVRRLPLALVPKVAGFLEETNLVNRPIYIGQAKQQTLKTRYDQHKQNFENQKPGTFGGRVSAAGLDWDDLTHVWVTVDPYLTENNSVMNFLERSLLLTCNPPMSIR